MDSIDRQLLEVYMNGFEDELFGRELMWNPNPLLLRTYNLGRQDAIIGDEVSNNDLQPDTMILKRIWENGKQK